MCIMLYNIAKNCKIKNVNFKILIFKLKTYIKNCYKIQSFAKHQNVKLNEDIFTMINDTFLRYDNYIINKNIHVIRHRKKNQENMTIHILYQYMKKYIHISNYNRGTLPINKPFQCIFGKFHKVTIIFFSS